jgi:aminomuconate-semialdehyde/2-hydroxymuconate-6-semialdehyde dehydrogenase
LSKVPRSTSSDVDAAVKAATAAFEKWSVLSQAERGDWMDRIANKIKERHEEFAQAESKDCGKPITAARNGDINRAIDNFKFFAGAVKHDFTDCNQTGQEALNYSYRSPIGVAGLITPWNLPIYLLSWKTAPALSLGNTVVAKPSELSPHTATLLASVCHELGLPAGVFNIVHGTGPVAGQSLVSHPDVPLISFTGGTATGANVGIAAAPLFKKVSLELGGKNATVIFDDCDWDKTMAETVRSSFQNAGQICLCGSRLFIHEKIYDRFVKELVEKVTALKCGDPSDSNTKLGALISAGHRSKVEYYVDVALKEGGKILAGGKRPDYLGDANKDGYFFEPTLIGGLSTESRCSQEEIFGPVVVLHSFSDEDQLMKKVNSTKYGLAGSLWTSDLKRAHRIAHKWHTGMVWINCWLFRDLRVPFGGVKHSGIGKEGGRYAIDFWTEVKNVCVYLK